MFSMSKFKFATLALVTSLSAFQIGCPNGHDQRRLAAGAAVGALVTAIVMSDSEPAPQPRYRRGRRPVYQDDRQQYETCRELTRQDCVTNQYGQCLRDQYGQIIYERERLLAQRCIRHYNAGSQNQSSIPEIDYNSINTEAVAKTFGLTAESARFLITSLQMVDESKTVAEADAAFARIGVKQDFIQSLSNGGKITAEMVNSVSGALMQKPEDTQNMLLRIMEGIKQQEADFNSEARSA